MSLSEQLSLFASAVGVEVKKLNDLTGKLADLNTTDKTALVAAINEVKGLADTMSTSLNGLAGRVTTAEGNISANSTAHQTNAGNISTAQAAISKLQEDLAALEGAVASSTNIDDANVGTATTYSSSKIESQITAAKQAVKDELLNGAGEAYDSLKELGDLIKTNQDAIDALEALAAGHVKYDGAQELTDEQKTQARTNIGAGAQTDVASLLSRMTVVETKANDNATDIAALETAVGDTTTDYVAVFNKALAGE